MFQELIKEFKMIGIKPIILILIFALLAWFFLWPIVECSYALSLDPLFDPIHKFYLFIIGGIALVFTIIHGRKLLI